MSDKIGTIAPLLNGRFQSPPVPGRGKKLVFVGTLYRDVREPDLLLRWFERLVAADPDFELHFYGTNQAGDSFTPFQHLIGQKIFLHGLVEQERARAALMEASAVVHIGNRNRLQLPSKIAECVATRKPLIHVMQTPDDLAGEILRSHPARFFVEGEPNAHSLGRLLDFLLIPPPVSEEWVTRFLAPYRPESVSRAYLQAMGVA